MNKVEAAIIIGKGNYSNAALWNRANEVIRAWAIGSDWEFGVVNTTKIAARILAEEVMFLHKLNSY